MNVDVCSVTQKDKRVFSFMTQAIGLMAELDLGTEHLRFMGDQYVLYLFSRLLAAYPPYTAASYTDTCAGFCNTNRAQSK